MIGLLRRARTIAGPLATLLIMAGCESSPSQPDRLDASLLNPLALDSNPSQLAVSQVVNGFGGYDLDAAGRPTVYLLDASQRPAAEAALSAFMESRGFSASDLVVRQGSFNYDDLDAWYRVLRPAVFVVPGIVLGDVDEGRNRVRIGVSDAGAAAAIAAVVTQLGVPQEAVVIEQRAPIVAMNTLRNRVRPLVGGLQINFFPTPASAPGVVSLLCTLGFNAQIFGVNSFITNSHCSNVEGGEETPTEYYQNSRAGQAANYIGLEVDDPHWTSQLNLDCPPPLACRYSDALRVAYAPGAEFSLGRIARVNEESASLADTTHDIAGEWRIRAERADPVQGEIAHKTGRTTGWTNGVTSGTCVDVLALGTNHIRLCQAMVVALVDGGDSGSPVFYRKGTNTNVTLLGILWGGSTDEANPEFSYSPLSGIERELGNLRVY